AAYELTSPRLTRRVLFGGQEQKRLMDGDRPNIGVHAGIGRAVQVDAGQNAGLLPGGESGGGSTHGVTYDPNLGQIQVAAPELILRIHFLELVENESHIRHQNLFCELANGNPLASSQKRFWWRMCDSSSTNSRK